MKKIRLPFFQKIYIRRNLSDCGALKFFFPTFILMLIYFFFTEQYTAGEIHFRFLCGIVWQTLRRMQNRLTKSLVVLPFCTVFLDEYCAENKISAICFRFLPFCLVLVNKYYAEKKIPENCKGNGKKQSLTKKFGQIPTCES